MRRVLLTFAVLALAGSPAALAQGPKTNAPPGNSAIDEYLEAVPSADGNTPTSTIVRAKQRALAGPTGRALRASGSGGGRWAQIVAATAPKKALDAATATGRGLPSVQGSETPGAEGRSPL